MAINYTDKEVFKNYRDFYVELKQERRLGESAKLKIYLLDNDDYIIQSDTKRLDCPFCKNNFSIYSFDCDNCGHTMHEICQKIYSEWNISGHRFYITGYSIDKYPLDKQQRYIYDSVRKFIIESIPMSIRIYFEKVIREIHLSTLFMIYQKCLGIDKVEEEINEEINREKKIAFKQAVKSDLENNVEAITMVWRYFQKYLDYKSGSIKFKESDFSKEIKISDTYTKNIDIKYFDNLYSILRQKCQKCFDEAYNDNVIVDYKACKHYVVYMNLLRRTPSIKQMKDMISLKIFGELDLSNDTIFATVNISLRDTIEGVEWGYHKGCDGNCERVYLKIPLLLSNGQLIIRTIMGTYCDKCRKYFVLDTEFRKMLCEGKIQAQISFSESGKHFYGMDLSPESLLRKCGYTVNANSRVTKEQRQKLLKAIIDNQLYTPSKIVSHFKFLISINNNVTSRDMSSAISKWQEDIIYLQQNYG